MEFICNRASGTEPPCKEAQLVKPDPRGYNLWTIEINNLDELMQLSEREGDLIIGTKHFEYGTPYLEIYDDYVE
jgi:hypothetical protein